MTSPVRFATLFLMLLVGVLLTATTASAQPFSPLNAGLTGVDDGSSSWGDFYGENDLDLVVTGVDDNGGETATIYENNPSSPSPQPPPATSGCIDLEDITPGTQFRNGDQFSSAGFTIQVDDYETLSGGTITDGTVTVDSSSFTPPFSGAGNEAFTSNVTLRVQFNATQSGLTFAYRDSGGDVNLEVNGDLRVVQALDSLDGKTVGGNPVQVRQVSSGTPVTGFLTVRGSVDEIAVGGQEFGVDDICPGCITFEDLATDTSFAQGASVTTGGYTVDLQPFTYASGDTATTGRLTVRNDTLKPFHLGNKAFMNNVVISPQFSSPEDTLSFVYENFGGNLNLRVNGDLRYDLSDFASLNGQTVGGTQVFVNSTPTDPGGYGAGVVTLVGTINDLGIGGQELYVDDICPRSRQDLKNVFTVNSTGSESDIEPGDGSCLTPGEECTLRAALEETNALSNDPAGPDEIRFDIPGSGPHTIQPQSALPDVTDPVVIDGSTEPDFSGDPVVAVDGSNQGINTNMLNLESGSGGSSVLALSLINVQGRALFIRTDSNLVDGCWFGLAPDGTVTNISAEGIRIFGSSNQVGRPNGSGNVVVNSYGIDLSNSSMPGNAVQNNLIGETPSGTEAGNNFGVSLGLGAGGSGNMIGGTGPNEGNVIAHNDNEGVVSTGGVETMIRGNQITDNGRLGIDLGGIDDGATPNDAGDGDDGANRLQNFPEIQGASYDAAANAVTVTYQVPSDPNASGSGASAYDLTIDFYRADMDEEEGEAYLGTDTYTTSDYNTSTGGPDPKTITFTPAAPASDTAFVVATATDANGNTSEFSAQPQQLPVELAGFEAVQTGTKAVELSWQTASETNNAGFRVQHRASDDEAWTTLGFVESKADGGTTTDAQSYRFSAEDLSVGTHRFRLAQVNLDGTATVHDPVAVELEMKEPLRLAAPAPNPVSGQAMLSFAVKESQTATLRLYDALGQQVATVYEGTPTAGESQAVQFEATDLASGVYFLRLRAGSHVRTQRLTVVQ